MKPTNKTIKRWKPEIATVYYYIRIDSDGEMWIDWYRWSNDDNDKKLYHSSNCFKTKKQAKLKLKKIKKVLSE